MKQLVSHIASTSIMTGLVACAYVKNWSVTTELSHNENEINAENNNTADDNQKQIVSNSTTDSPSDNSLINKTDNINTSDNKNRESQAFIPLNQVPSSVKMTVQSYAELFGFACTEHNVTTDDGFVLTLHRVMYKQTKPEQNKGPILIMHGLFQSSGVFVTSGIDSLAFVLARSGYDVWLGNNRCVAKLHEQHRAHDYEFWNWSLDELATHDFPTLIDFVLKETSQKQLVYIGHSQGTSQAFLGMSFDPSSSSKIKCFVALAPALYLGSLLQKPPVSLMVNASAETFDRIFGKKEFVPLMTPVQSHFPAHIFSSIAYNMFNFLFGWSDQNWDIAHKPAYFHFTPRPTSSKAIKHWFQLAKHGYLKSYHEALQHPNSHKNMDCEEQESPEVRMRHTDSAILMSPVERIQYDSEEEERDILGKEKFETQYQSNFINMIDLEQQQLQQHLLPKDRFDLRCIHCPMVIFYGGKDEIVDADRLVKECQYTPQVKLLYAERIEHYEHLDVLWATNAKQIVFDKILSILDKL